MPTWHANYSPSLRELSDGSSERRIAVELGGRCRSTSSWVECRLSGLTAAVPAGTNFLNVRATDLNDRSGGAGAQAVRVLGFREMSPGAYRPAAVEIPLLDLDNATTDLDWFYPIGATSVNTNTGNIDITIGPYTPDGHLRMEATMMRADRSSLIIPPNYRAFVESMSVAPDPPFATGIANPAPAVRINARTIANFATPRYIFHPKTVIEPGTLIIVEAWGPAASGSFLQAQVILRLSRADTLGSYRQWAGDIEEVT